MRLLLIHSDHIEYEARKKTKAAEEDAVLKDGLDEALAVFCAVESLDEENIDDAVRQAVEEIVNTARQLGTTNIMIYPYAHLSSDLASPEVAVSALRDIEEALREQEDDFVVRRAPFGWYKA
ncbi:MAG: threonyl-tRNA synthetase editing domain-containing protein, partial [Methanoculleus sp.]